MADAIQGTSTNHVWIDEAHPISDIQWGASPTWSTTSTPIGRVIGMDPSDSSRFWISYNAAVSTEWRESAETYQYVSMSFDRADLAIPEWDD